MSHEPPTPPPQKPPQPPPQPPAQPPPQPGPPASPKIIPITFRIGPQEPPEPAPEDFEPEGPESDETSGSGAGPASAGLWERIGDVHPGFTYALTLAILAGFALQLVTTTVPVSKAVAGGSLVGPLVSAGAIARAPFLAGEWWRALSSIFLHANVLHVGSNLLAFVILGGVAERALGHGRFLVLFVAAAAAGSAASVWQQGNVATLGSIGASGAVYGVGAAVVAIALRLRGLLPAWRVRALIGATLPLLLASLAGGFQKPGTDNAAHVGGVLAGVALGLVLPFHPALRGRSEAPSARVLWGAAGLVALALTIASGAVAVLRGLNGV